MQRVLLVCNAVLALFLAIRLFTSGAAPVEAATDPDAPWTSSSLSVLPVVDQQGGVRRVREVIVDFGVEMAVPAATVGSDRFELADLGVRLDGDVPSTCTWRDGRSVRLVAARWLPPATTFHVVCERALRARDGRELPPGAVLPFDTPSLRLLGVLVDEPGEDLTTATLTVSFDMEISREAAQRGLSVRTVEDPPRTLAATVGLVDGRATAEAAVLHLREDQPLPERIDVVVAESLVPVGGKVPLGRAIVHRVALRQPLEILGIEAGDGGIEIHASHALPLPLDGALALHPAVPFQVRRTSRGLRVLGEFAPGAVVQLAFAEGFPGTGARRLRSAQRRAVLVPDRATDLGFATGGTVLCASALPRVPLRGCNVERPFVRLRAVYGNNVVRAMQTGDERALEPASAVPLPVAAARNEVWTQELDLQALRGASGPLRGAFLLEVWDGERSWRRERRWLQITDLGVTARCGRGSAVVQVLDLVRGTPVDGAEVELLTPTNQRLAAGATDADGLLQLAWPHGGEDAVPFAVVARRGDDVSFVDLRTHGVELADPTLGGRAFAGERPEAWVWPTRGIARPGETVEVAVLLRDAGGRAVPGRELEVACRTASGRVVRRERVTTPGSGLLHVALPLSPDAPTGRYTVEAAGTEPGDDEVFGRAAFLVEAFVPDRLEVAIADVAPLRFAGIGTVRVRGNWLDGTPAAGRPVVLRARLVPHVFAPAGRETFSFAAGTDDAPPGELPAVEGVLDDRGEAELQILLPADAAQQTLAAHLAVEVIDPSGRAVHAATTAPVLRGGAHFGVRSLGDAAEVCAVDADGAAVPGAVPVAVRLEQRSWEWRYETRGGRWRWHTERTATTVGEWNVTLQDGTARVPLPPPGRDEFVVLTVDGRAVEAPHGQPSARPDRLRVRGPVDAVAPGASATLRVTAPAAGRGLVTIESDRLHAATVVQLERGDNEIAVPIPADLALPNVHAVVTLSRGAKDSGPDLGPAWLIGGAAVRLAHPRRALEIALAAPGETLPESTLSCAIEAPGATTALLALVDEGVLAITRHASPDPLAFFLAQRALATDGADSGSALLERMTFAAGVRTGGDGGDESGLEGLLAGSIDSRIRPVALFAAVTLDAAGRGTVSLSLPVYEGRLRAMVVAAGPDGIGAASRPIVVAAPLGLQVALPRMVAPGDRFRVPITLHNHTDQDGTAIVECAAAGALRLDGTGRYEVPVGKGRAASIDVALLVADAADGAALASAVPALDVTATLGAERRQRRVEVSVREAAVTASESFGFDLAFGGELEVTDAWLEVEARVRLDAAPDRQLGPVLERLLEYPYGCAEQTASKGLALLTCQALLPRLWGEADPRLQNVHALVQAAVDRILGMQTARGGFGWWPAASRESPFLSAHVLDFLLAARDRGFAVPEHELGRALDRLAGWIRDENDIAVRCVAVDVLARAGRPVQPWLDWLCVAAEQDEDRLRLASTLGRLGLVDRARAMLVDDPEAPTRRETRGTLRSPLRTQALRLAARLAIDPADPELAKFALALQRAILRDGNATTQENVWCLRTLAEHYRRLPTPGAVAVGEVTVDGRAVPIEGGAATIALARGSVLRFAPGGRGVALVELRGRRRPLATHVEQGLRLARRVVDVDTGETVDRFVRGRLYEIRIEGHATEPVWNVAVVDLLPGGLEAEPDRAPGTPRDLRRDDDPLTPDQVERRDDRVLLFCSTVLAGRFELRHRVRAVTPGSWQWPALIGEAMYDPAIRAVTATGRAEIAP